MRKVVTIVANGTSLEYFIKRAGVIRRYRPSLASRRRMKRFTYNNPMLPFMTKPHMIFFIFPKIEAQ